MRKTMLTAVLLTAMASQAATRWVNPLDAGFPVVQNQAWPSELSSTYHRLPDRAEKMVRKPLWDLSRNSAGLALEFTTDAPSIIVRYTLDGSYSMPHMPATGVSGVDLYRNSGDKEEFCFGNYSFGDTVRFTYRDLPAGTATYTLNLPLYNTVKWLEIGIPDNATIQFKPQSQEKPVVVYGTSIAQGACSSRPGMAWANIVRRNLGMPVVNLGFSGNGRLEPEMIALLSEIDAGLYLLDCMPNLTNKSADEARDLVLDAVRSLRLKSQAPILLVEHAGYSNAPTNAEQMDIYTRLNRGQREAFQQLQSEGIPNLYYITHDELGFTPDSWVDYVHPSDLGAQKQADALVPRIKAILNR